MIKNLANLGPSKTADLGGAFKRDLGINSQGGKIEKSESFGDVFQKENLRRNNQDAQTNVAKPTPAPVKRDIERSVPEKIESERISAKSDASDSRAAQRKEGAEPGSVKEKGRSEEVGENSSEKEAKVRQSVMLDFMDSMESEFGIPPTRMVEAMANLSDQALQSSPEATASQVIAQLDLAEEEKPQAYAMYMGMLAQLAELQKPQPQMQPAMVAGAAAAATVPAMLTNQQRRDLLNQSLDKMNSQFFMKGSQSLRPAMTAEGMVGKNALPDSGLGESLVRDQISMGQGMNQGYGSKLQPPTKLQQPMPDIQPLPDGGLSLQSLGLENIDPNSSEAKELAAKLAALGAATAALGEGMKSDPANVQALKAESTMNQMNLDGAMNSMKSEILAGDRENQDSGNRGQDGSQSSFMVHHASGQTHAAKALGNETQQSFGALLAGASAMGANAATDQADNKATVQQLMNQANFMIKKGGGEAKVQLNPEGLGEIQMKVSVNDGKVGIEMSAETKEAKKLIESSLSDLKSSLNQHRLGLETVKVDVGNQTSSENKNSEQQSQQRQMNQQQDQKNQAREFWNQFNDGRNERRAAFMDSPGIRAYSGTRKVEPLTPDTTSTKSMNRPSGSGKGRGLDLVA